MPNRKRNSSHDGLFDKEEELLRKARSIMEDPSGGEASLREGYGKLLRGYERLFSQLRHLVKTGDRQQLKLNKLNDQLDMRTRFIKRTFSRYLSDDIVESILESPEGSSLGGEKRVVTLLMSDLRGFTALTERLPAENIVRILNIYLEAMTDIIFKYRGTIDEFIGDGILALFGAPVPQENHAPQAVACALEMQLAMIEVNRKCREAGFPELDMGIGINTGELVVGNFGSPKRLKFGVVGSHVNLTSRIESFTVGGQVFISDSTRQQCNHLLRIDGSMEFMPKGMDVPISIYEVGGIGGEYDRFLPEKEVFQLRDLEAPLPVTFSILTGKTDATRPYEGRIVGLCEKEAEISAHRNVRKLSNLKINIQAPHVSPSLPTVYAKVTENLERTPPAFRIHFTSVPPDAREFLNRML